MVIRSEHAVEDWNSIENGLSGLPNVVSEFPRNNKTSSITSTTNGDTILSATATRLLCEALCEDIQVYKYLIYSAINLDSDDYFKSIRELSATCPLEARANTCL
jgi:hypothetical protein